MLLKAFRNCAGYLIVLIDRLTRPKSRNLNNEALAKQSELLKGHSLYQLYACPFCVKTRRAMHKLSADLEIRDIGKDPIHRASLLEGGGRVKVPCLRIEENNQVSWMYESNSIIDYLQKRLL